ncbi:Hemin transport system permease protein HmuU [Thalassocella blandensis]|nr:Hemin transport system permease protein HmuU [Thalassocella blandensis]
MIFHSSGVALHWRWLLSGALVVLCLCAVISISFGAVSLSLSEIGLWLQGKSSLQTQIIIEDIRLPRMLLALCIGALLALCGTVTQGLFRNPLADPSLIGVSAGASAGASIVIVLLSQLHWNMLGVPVVSVGAFIGGLIAVMVVYRIATGVNGTSVATMLLAGIAITFLTGSLSSILEFYADDEMLRRISLWRMGGLDAANYTHAMIAASVLIVLLVLLPQTAKALDAFLLGESEARHLGIDVDKIKYILIVSVAVGVGVAVALAGSIAFVGLVVPHMLRMLVGPAHRFLLPLSAIGGAVLLLLSDVLSRTLVAPTELPVGILTAFLGAPLFISLLRHRHEYGMR